MPEFYPDVVESNETTTTTTTTTKSPEDSEELKYELTTLSFDENYIENLEDDPVTENINGSIEDNLIEDD